MPLFIVKGSYTYTPYMSRAEKPVEVMHPVVADDDNAAREKFCKFYHDKGDAHGDSYWPSVEDVFETIE